MTTERKISLAEFKMMQSGNHGKCLGLLQAMSMPHMMDIMGCDHYAAKAAEIVAEHDAIKLLEIDYSL